jgi:hypothetical protein
VAAIYVSSVKSLRVQSVEAAFARKAGLAGDRAFVMLDERGRVLTIREHSGFVQIRATYDAGADALALAMPDGAVVAGVVEDGGDVTASMFGDRDVACREVIGPWARALSGFARRDVRLARVEPGQGFDGYPVSVCSRASVEALARAAGRGAADERMFRQNIMLEGVGAHEEDAWIGHEVRIGGVVLRVKARDPRCVVTTRHPETGEHEMDTLKAISRYRTDQPKEVNFGVYATVAAEGMLRVGDGVEVRV